MGKKWYLYWPLMETVSQHINKQSELGTRTGITAISATPVLVLWCNYGETALRVRSLLHTCRRQRCTHLPDRHCAEDVEEDEGAVSVILTQKVAVGQTLDV